MTLKDLQLSQTIMHPIKGRGLITKLTARTISIRYEKVTSKRTFRKLNTEFEISEL